MGLRKKFLQTIFRSKTAKKFLQTVGGPATIQALESALQPLSGVKNKYESYKEFLRMDPELNNAVTRLALLAQFAYKGIIVRAEHKLTADEKKLQEEAIKATESLDFRGKYFAIARHLLRDGDEVFVTHLEDNTGIKQFQPLPIARITAVEKEDQIGNVDKQIFGANIYVLNEGVEDKQQKFPENEEQTVHHIALDNYGEEITDLMGRYTFGVWSESPLACLSARVLWKQAILITDILWRYRNVPREVHELDTSMYTPEKFAGDTWEDKLQSYQSAIQALLKAHAQKIQKKKVDQGYVHPKGTRIYYAEPSKVTYTSPNELIEQINQSIREGMGAYNVEAGTYATALVVSSYVVLLPDFIAYKISKVFLELLKSHLRKKHNFKEELLDKLQIRLSLILDIFRGELIRQLALLTATNTWTLDELREYVGKLKLTDEQIERLAFIVKKSGREGEHMQTVLDILANTARTREGEPITPESRRDRQET